MHVLGVLFLVMDNSLALTWLGYISWRPKSVAIWVLLRLPHDLLLLLHRHIVEVGTNTLIKLLLLVVLLLLLLVASRVAWKLPFVLNIANTRVLVLTLWFRAFMNSLLCVLWLLFETVQVGRYMKGLLWVTVLLLLERYLMIELLKEKLRIVYHGCVTVLPFLRIGISIFTLEACVNKCLILCQSC